MDFYCHPTCTTCKKAQNWLNERGVSYNWINLKEETPAKKTFLELLRDSNRTVKSLFNTSGQKYRELNLKDRLPEMSEEEIAELLASDGMLIKRPFAIEDNKVTIGFKEPEYEKAWQDREE